jgi:glycosyltransferase involved in cell wall biosynthesis
MKIAIDSATLGSKFRNMGTYVYAHNLISQFRRLDGQSQGVEFCVFNCPGFANDANLLQPGGSLRLSNTKWLCHERLWKLGGASRAAAGAGADLLFVPTVSTAPVGRVPVVCTIHDVTPVRLPSHSAKVMLVQRALLWSLARFARAIITDSQCSKHDLIETYGLPEHRVSVVYLGYDKAIFNDAATDPELQSNLRKRLGIGDSYIVHHGVIQPRKNLKRLIEAYRMMLEMNRNIHADLVLAGPLGWQYADILAAAQANAGSRGRVVLTGALADTDLVLLLKGAALAVVPSLYEGFCLPMVEAMACGAPTVTASASCLPEISGGVLEYFDPLSVEDMSDCMQRGLESEELRKALSQKGRERARVFDWQRCAQETLDILKREGHQ